ncbi:hypothetical protein PR003_g20423 [Phytophthora rubi]|uniref:Uncharacterized protein n=1 Tax=Phytophthora rubi TaxID=129364 RepID=A0A6A4DK12_9STRA|nr:hypothetical protein PR003_g20423 [Phytophthora rubi]
MTELQNELASGAITGKSLEIEDDAAGVALLRSNFDLKHDLVVGTALPGHLGNAGGVETAATDQDLLCANGRRMRLQLEGVGLAGGDEEVSTISMYQQHFANTPAVPTRAKLTPSARVVWQVADFKDPKRVAWHTMKKRSKKQRMAAQMAHFGVFRHLQYYVERLKTQRHDVGPAKLGRWQPRARSLSAQNSWSVLHLLSKYQSGEDADLVSSIHQLLAARVEVNLQTTVDKKSPLHFLCENEAVSVDALDAILKAKPDTNGTATTPLAYLAQ